MVFIRTRLILTGACHTAYSGKQVELIVPLAQDDGSNTTMGHIVDQLRRDWPNDLSEMSESIKTVSVKVLKTGRVLADTDVFVDQLSRSERQDCEVKSSDAGEEEGATAKSAVNIHVVFQRPVDPSSSTNQGKPKGSKQDGSNPATRDSTVSDDGGCCVVM